jgi:hypothetical protein
MQVRTLVVDKMNEVTEHRAKRGKKVDVFITGTEKFDLPHV